MRRPLAAGPSTPSLSTFWCEGKLFTGTRETTSAERQWMRDRRRRALWKLGVGIIFMVAPFCAAIGLMIIAHPAGPPRPAYNAAATVAFIAWMMLLLPLGILILRDAAFLRSNLSRDVAEPRVWQFQDLAVLPASRIIHDPEECRGRNAHVVSAAPRPENAYRVATEVVHTKSGETRSATQRRLSDDELGELIRHGHARVWSWWFLWPAFLGAGWIVAAIKGKRPWLGALAATVAVWMAFQLWRAFHLRRALRRDAVTGTAMTIPETPKDPEHEFLPGSGLVWTTAGVPAMWRFSPVRRN